MAIHFRIESPETKPHQLGELKKCELCAGNMTTQEVSRSIAAGQQVHLCRTHNLMMIPLESAQNIFHSLVHPFSGK